MLRPVGHVNERTLVLNRSWFAITTTTVRRALSLVYADAAQIICPTSYEVHDFTSWIDREPRNGEAVVRGVSFHLCVPEIIVLSRYDRVPKRTVAFSRRNLYRRDGYTCRYCGQRPRADELTIDHVVPRSQGGRTNWENCVLACEGCNKRKGNRSHVDAGMSLTAELTAPQWSWEEELTRGGVRPSWQRFLPKTRSRRARLG